MLYFLTSPKYSVPWVLPTTELVNWTQIFTWRIHSGEIGCINQVKKFINFLIPWKAGFGARTNLKFLKKSFGLLLSLKYKPAVGNVSEFSSTSIFWICVSCVCNGKPSPSTPICAQEVVTLLLRNGYPGSRFGGDARWGGGDTLRALLAITLK